MRQLVLEERRRQVDEHGTAGAIVAAESGFSFGDDLFSFANRDGPGAERHRVHMRHEQKCGPGTVPGK